MSSNIAKGSSLDGIVGKKRTVSLDRPATESTEHIISIDNGKNGHDNDQQMIKNSCDIPSNLKIAESKEDIIKFLKDGYFVNIDPLTYDLRKEANSEIKYCMYSWLEDIFVNVFTPFSYIYVYFKYGLIGLWNRHLITGINPLRLNPLEHDLKPPKTQMKAKVFFFTNCYNIIAKYMMIICYVLGGYHISSSNNSNRTNAPTYYIVLVVICYMSFIILIGSKKALRSPESETRLLLQREKRNEELLNGWLPLPWWIAIFELRIAAIKVQLDLNERIFFKNVSYDELRQSIGEKVLFYLKSSSSPSDIKYSNNYDIPMSMCQGIHAQEHIFDEMKTRGGSSCTVLALLLRGCLEQSYATPWKGEDATIVYAIKNNSRIWFTICCLVSISPIICDLCLQNGNVKYDIYGILCCFFALMLLPFSFFLAPQGFIFSAILNIRRKARLLCFLNNLLDSKTNINHHNKWKSEWKHEMDYSTCKNIELWSKCRTCYLKFGRKYQQRTDMNAGMIVFFLAISTGCFIFYTAASSSKNTNKIQLKSVGFYVFLYLFLLLSFSLFSIYLCIEGETCDEMGLRTKTILSNTIMKFESNKWNSISTSTSINSKSSTSKVVENNASSLNDKIIMGKNQRKQISLQKDKDIKNSEIINNELENIIDNENFVDYHAIRNNTNQLHSLIDNATSLYGNKVLGIPLNRALIGTIIFLCFTQVTLLIENTTLSSD